MDSPLAMSASCCHCCMDATRSACWSACYQLRRASSRQHLKLMRKAPEHHHSRPPNVARPDGDGATTALCRSPGRHTRVRLLAPLVGTVGMIVGPKLCRGRRASSAMACCIRRRSPSINVAHPDGDGATTALCRSPGRHTRVRLLAPLVGTVGMIVGPILCRGRRTFTAVKSPS